MRDTKIVLGICLLILWATPLHGVHPIFKNIFHVEVPESVLKEKKIPPLIDILKKNDFKAYKKGKCIPTASYYGTFQFSQAGPNFLWLYRNNNVHSGIFAIFNSALELVYYKPDMGCLYNIETKDFLHDGKTILMVTHGAGGTGTYTTLTDLINNNNGIPELKLSLLSELRDCNIATGTDASVCIRCYARHEGFKNLTRHILEDGCPAVIIETNVEAHTDSQVTSKERAKINSMLKKHYGLELDKVVIGATKALVKSLDPIIIYPEEFSLPICPGFIIPGYAWPSLHKIGQ